jgi:hypothetical protein
VAFALRFGAVVILTLTAIGAVSLAEHSDPFVVIITPKAGTTVEYSVVLAGAVMEHARTQTPISRSVAKEQSAALLVQAEPGTEALVEISRVVGNQRVPAVSANGQNIAATVLGGQAEIKAFQ